MVKKKVIFPNIPSDIGKDIQLLKEETITKLKEGFTNENLLDTQTLWFRYINYFLSKNRTSETLDQIFSSMYEYYYEIEPQIETNRCQYHKGTILYNWGLYAFNTLK